MKSCCVCCCFERDQGGILFFEGCDYSFGTQFPPTLLQPNLEKKNYSYCYGYKYCHGLSSFNCVIFPITVIGDLFYVIIFFYSSNLWSSTASRKCRFQVAPSKKDTVVQVSRKSTTEVSNGVLPKWNRPANMQNERKMDWFFVHLLS